MLHHQQQTDADVEAEVRYVRAVWILLLSSASLVESLERGLQPLAESWSGVRLEHTSTYGIRRYTDGSWLIAHIDRFKTHVISAILNIGQAVREEWPLFIMDNTGTSHQVILQPGEMVWYESARLLHGRPQLLDGDYYDNLFIHYRPTDLWYTEEPGVATGQSLLPYLPSHYRSEESRESLRLTFKKLRGNRMISNESF